MTVIHIAPSGNDWATGSEHDPLRSINAGTRRAGPGDTVLVHAGIYREWVDLPRGGHRDSQRLTIAAAEGERVVISGAEPLTAWEALGDGLWACLVPDSWFLGTNTLRTELMGDWFWHKHRPQHLGALYCNGISMFEVTDRAAVAAREPWPEAADPGCTRLAWCVEPAAEACRIVAHFDGADPNVAVVELSVREACIYPRRTGVDWVTLRGIECRHAASPWAPPTAEQIAMVGPNWAKGWIIEDCHLHHARCSAISLGAPAFIGDNRWTREQVKHGTQREREVVFTALHHGWSRETVGSHILRRNHIHHCEQTAICGHLGAVFSEIRDNHIHHIHTVPSFGGHEMAGIKLHAAIDTRIVGNHIHDTVRGIWLDWQAQGARVTGNLIHQSASEDFYIEVCHGPTIVDHNCFLSAGAVKNCSQGTAFVHNLIAGSVTMQPIPIRYTPYHLPHSTQVMGLMTILGGDDRWLHNLFLAPETIGAAIKVEDENADLARAGEAASPYGLSCYDDWPSSSEHWIPTGGVPAYAAARLPVEISGNAFGPGTSCGRHQSDASLLLSAPVWRLEATATGRTRLVITGLDGLPEVAVLAANALGSAFQAECAFEDPVGIREDWTRDLTDAARDHTTRPGPFDARSAGSREWPGA